MGYAKLRQPFADSPPCPCLLQGHFPGLAPYGHLFRWLYFGGTIIPLYCALSLLMEFVFEEIEVRPAISSATGHMLTSGSCIHKVEISC